ncbi:MAG: ABC transporter permease [Anaerolineales bacterium]
MLNYMLRRILVLPLIMFIVTLILFFMIMQLPIEQRVAIYIPATGAQTGLDPEKSQDLVENTIQKYGLDKPFPVQYVTWIKRLFIGKWGYSPTWKQPVLEGLLERIPSTAELALTAFFPSILLALVMGGIAGKYRGKWPDHLIRITAFILWAFPSFILGLLLMNVFYAWTGWFPPGRISIWASPVIESESFANFSGMYVLDALLNGNLKICLDAIRHLVLPAFTLAGAQWALLTRIMRSSLIETLNKDYIKTARAKGLTEHRVVNLHARRNALIPVISTGGVAVSLLLSLVVVIEAVFARNGIGNSAAEAIKFSDIPVAIGFAVFSCAVTVIASLIADLLYGLIDPRVRLTDTGR